MNDQIIEQMKASLVRLEESYPDARDHRLASTVRRHSDGINISFYAAVTTDDDPSLLRNGDSPEACVEALVNISNEEKERRITKLKRDAASLGFLISGLEKA
jgi:hypothetical protein